MDWLQSLFSQDSAGSAVSSAVSVLWVGLVETELVKQGRWAVNATGGKWISFKC